MFAEKSGWAVKRWQPRTVDKAFDELILGSKDSVSGEHFICAFKTEDEPISVRYNWKLFCAPEFYQVLAFEQIPDKNPYHYMYLWDDPIDYYFITDSACRHLKVVAQVSTTTHVIYMGRINMYASIQHWPNQCTCFGEGTEANAKWNDQSNKVSTFQFARNMARHAYWLDKNWIPVEYTAPMQPSGFSGFFSGAQTSFLCGDFWLVPMFALSDVHGNLGEFVGCYFISGPNIATGMVMKEPGKDRLLLIVQNVHRSSDNDFMALELS